MSPSASELGDEPPKDGVVGWACTATSTTKTTSVSAAAIRAPAAPRPITMSRGAASTPPQSSVWRGDWGGRAGRLVPRPPAGGAGGGGGGGGGRPTAGRG